MKNYLNTFQWIKAIITIFLMFVHNPYKLKLCYASYIIINIKTLIKARKRKKKEIKHNNLRKSIVFRHLVERHTWKKQQRQYKPFSFG